MRRMVTKSGIIDAVNEGIESGEIEAGGLPEFSEADTGRVLTVVEDAETGDPVASWQDAAGGGAFKYLINDNTSSDMTGLVVTGVNSSDAINVASATWSAINGIYLDIHNGDKISKYTISNKSGSNVNIPSILMADLSSKGGYLPAMRGSILIGGTLPAVNTTSEYIYNSILLNMDYNNNYLYSKSIFETNIIMGAVQGGTFNTGGYLKNNFILGDNALNYNSCYNYKGNFIFSGNDYGITWTLNSNNPTSLSSTFIFEGAEDRIQINSTATSAIKNIVAVGNGHLINYANNGQTVIVGNYGTADASTERFVVGNGVSTSSRANCFVVGNDGTDDYIKVGNTKITETQLQALLALLN